MAIMYLIVLRIEKFRFARIVAWQDRPCDRSDGRIDLHHKVVAQHLQQRPAGIDRADAGLRQDGIGFGADFDWRYINATAESR